MILFKKQIGDIIGEVTFPFHRTISSNAAENFLTSECTKCQREINIGSLLGNSLVATAGGITIVCASCRLKRNFSIDQRVASRDETEKYLRTVGKLCDRGVPWIVILVSLRMGAIFTLLERPKWLGYRFITTRSWFQEEPIQDLYGSTKRGLQCGECGLFDSFPSELCSNCHFPIEYQWAFRSTFHEEMDLLAHMDIETRIDKLFE